MGIAAAFGQPFRMSVRGPYIHLRLPPIHHRDLVPLIDQRDSLRLDLFAPGHQPHQIPQQRGLSAAGGREQQRACKMLSPEKPGHHRRADALLLPGNANHRRGYLLEICDLSVLHDRRAAQPHPEAAAYRQKALPQRFD